MEKTFLTFKGKRFFYYLIIITSSFLITHFFNGCTPSKGPEIDADRQKDSLGIYTVLDKAMLQYKQTLTLNENEQTAKAKDAFEQTLTILKKVDNRVLENPKYSAWKKDYSELVKSVVQDYLYTQTNISDKSSVFKFAKKFGVEYTVNKEVTETESNDPLPNGSDVPLVRNKAVDEYIDFFSKTDRGRGFMDKSFYRSGKYFPIMRKILKFNNAPEELIYLSVQESGLNPTIVSRAGAVGLWQFMPSTGSSYGLFQDNYRDDRRDFEKETDAAARHLKDLYRSFGDWYLAFAAYNAGPGRITNAINKSGSKDYWDIRPYLPGETKNYVPSILALSFIFRSPEEYGFKDIEYGQPLSFDRVNIKGEISLEKVAEYCKSDIETIRDLNPELYNDMVPNYEVPYLLRIPHGTFKTFFANYERSPEYDKNGRNAPEFAGNEQKGFVVTESKDVTYKLNDYDPGEPRYVGVSTNKKKLSYFYRGSEQLSTIADSFNVRPTDLRIWNNIPYATTVKPNQELSVYLSTKMYNKFYGIKEEPKEEKVEVKDTASNKNETLFEKVKEKKNQTEVTKTKEKTNDKTASKEKEKTTTNTKTKEKKTTSSGYETYTVKTGDYLSNIAEDYGVSLSDLKEWNNIDGDKIIVGQKLKIYTDKKVTENKSKEKKTKVTTHTVQDGENLTLIAQKYNLDVEDLMDWNDLDNDVIVPGQKLTLVEPKKEKKTIDKKIKSKAKTHTVKEGENLTLIAEKYGLTLKQIKDWNDLDNDVIVPGQVLTVSAPSKDKKNEKEKEKQTNPKTYKVKKGDTLQTIAEDFSVSVKDLKKWNELDDDVIVIGQVLKVSAPKKKK